jgi:hypothetical protein
MKSDTVNLGTQRVVEFKVQTEEVTERIPLDQGDYIVAMINMTDYCMERGRITYAGQQPGPWFPITRTCRTCSLPDPDQCFNQRQYVPVINTGCTEPPFELTLNTMPDPHGTAWGATWDINPNCQYPGGVIALIP